MPVRLIAIAAIFLASFGLFSCSSGVRPSPTLSSPADGILDASERQREAVSSVEKSRNRIQQSAESIQSRARAVHDGSESPEIRQTARQIEDESVKIREEVTRIEENLDTLRSTEKVFRDAAKTVEALESKVQQLESRVEEERARAIGNLFTYLGWIFGLGVVMLIVGGLMMFFNPRTGAIVLIIGFLSTGIAAAATYHLGTVALIGIIVIGIGTLASLGFIGYTFWKAKQEKQSNIENIELVEVLKNLMDEDTKREVFGDDAHRGIAEAIQSDSTKKAVKKYRRDQRVKDL